MNSNLGRGTGAVCVWSHNTDKLLLSPRSPPLLPCADSSVTQMSVAGRGVGGVLAFHQLVVPESV